MKTLITWVVIILVVIAGFFWWTHRGSTAPSTAQQLLSSATFACGQGTTIAASFYEGSTTPVSAGQPPTPNGSVQLTLSDGTMLTLPQTLSADGARYANADESTVFWEKGNGATFTQGSQPADTCIAVAADPGGLPQSYQNTDKGFSLRYPTGYTVDESYTYQELGPGKDIGGVKFTVASSTTAGTNLSSDTYLSVEEIPNATTCSASLFVDKGAQLSTVTENGTTYSMATSSDAGAGNRYDETVYALPGTNPCVAVRYFIHYGAFENFPAGTVTQFNEAALVDQFDTIRRTLTIGQ